MNAQPLDGKTAIVTGAAQGIGYAIARRFSTEGARVAIVDVDLDGAQRAADEIGGSAIAVGADVARADEVDRAFAEVVDRFGGVDILVNNAGIVGTDRPVRDLDEADWNRVLDINLKGTFLCSRAAVRHCSHSCCACGVFSVMIVELRRCNRRSTTSATIAA